MSPGAVPFFPRGVRCAQDRVRGGPVLLGPERVLMLDRIGTEVLGRVNGMQSIRAISEDLARSFSAPLDQIEGDVLEYLQDLAEKRLVEFKYG